MRERCRKKSTVAGQATISVFGCFSPAVVNCSRVGRESPLTGVGVLPSGEMSQVGNREIICQAVTIMKRTI